MAIDLGYNLGKMLIDEKVISKEQLAQAQATQAKQGGSLGFNLALLGAVSEEEVSRFIAMAHALEYVDLSTMEVDPESLKVLTQDTAVKNVALPIRRKGNSLVVAVVDPSDSELSSMVKEIKFKKNWNTEYVVAPESYIKIAIEHYYGQLAAMGQATQAPERSAPPTGGGAAYNAASTAS